jgi:hypothetical protein
VQLYTAIAACSHDYSCSNTHFTNTLCLRNLQKSRVLSLNARLLRQAVLPDGDDDDSDDDSDGDDGDDSDDGELLPMHDGQLLYHEHDLWMNSQIRHLFTSLSVASMPQLCATLC